MVSVCRPKIQSRSLQTRRAAPGPQLPLSSCISLNRPQHESDGVACNSIKENPAENSIRRASLPCTIANQNRACKVTCERKYERGHIGTHYFFGISKFLVHQVPSIQYFKHACSYECTYEVVYTQKGHFFLKFRVCYSPKEPSHIRTGIYLMTRKPHTTHALHITTASPMRNCCRLLVCACTLRLKTWVYLRRLTE